MHKRDDEIGPMRASNEMAKVIYKGIDSGLSWSDVAIQLQRDFSKSVPWIWWIRKPDGTIERRGKDGK